MEKTDINEFHTQFNRSVKEVEAIENVELKKQRVLDLKGQVEAIAHALPSYQQLSYSDVIRSLLGSLEKEKPKRRFQFSQRSRTQQKSSLNTKQFEEKEVKPTVTDVQGSHLMIEDSSVLVTDVSRCTVYIPQSSAVSLRNVNDSTFVINCSGPVFVQRALNCILFISCHQLRIHETSKTKIIADIPSGRGVIEGCKDLEIEGIRVDDFDCPNGESTNYKMCQFDELRNLKEQVRSGTADLSFYIKRQ
jgi:hypothetical protein